MNVSHLFAVLLLHDVQLYSHLARSLGVILILFGALHKIRLLSMEWLLVGSWNSVILYLGRDGADGDDTLHKSFIILCINPSMYMP